MGLRAATCCRWLTDPPCWNYGPELDATSAIPFSADLRDTPPSFDSSPTPFIPLAMGCPNPSFIGLRVFSWMGKLSHMEQRGFNSITILLGALASLGLGSMLGHLGSMLRWRLLARKKYKMQDVCDARSSPKL